MKRSALLKAMIFALILAMLLGGCEFPFNANNAANNEPEEIPPLIAPAHDLEDEKEKAPPRLPKDPLVGEIIEEDNSMNRPYCVVIDNARAALPARGISQAGVIFEYNVEASVTRFLALFQDIRGISAIGAVRSCRAIDVSINIAFDGIFTHAGGSPDGLNDIIIKHVADLDAVYGNYKFFYRDKTRRINGYEHTLFTNPAQMEKLVPGIKVTRGMQHLEDYKCCLRFGRQDMSAGTEAVAVTVRMNGSKTTQFDYKEDAGCYLVSEFGDPLIDANNNEIVAVKNVLALKVGYKVREDDKDGRKDADLTSGEGAYCTGGKIIKIRWSFSEEEGFKFTCEDGSELKLAVGGSYICLLDKESGSIEASYLIGKQ